MLPSMPSRFASATYAACILGGTTLADDRGLIEIRGRIFLDDGMINGTVLIVEVNEADCVPFDLSPDGHFAVSVPIDSKATIRFEKDGYMTKDVVIDTRNALLTKEAVRKNKLVRFDVELHPEPQQDRMYAGPVGAITFVRGTGLMRVKYDRNVVPVPVTLAQPAVPEQGSIPR